MDEPRSLPPRGPVRLKPGADPFATLAAIAATLDSLTAQVNALAACFTTVALMPNDPPARRGPQPRTERRVFGRQYPDEASTRCPSPAGDSDATGVVPPDPAA